MTTNTNSIERLYAKATGFASLVVKHVTNNTDPSVSVLRLVISRQTQAYTWASVDRDTYRLEITCPECGVVSMWTHIGNGYFEGEECNAPMKGQFAPAMWDLLLKDKRFRMCDYCWRKMTQPRLAVSVLDIYNGKFPLPSKDGLQYLHGRQGEFELSVHPSIRRWADDQGGIIEDNCLVVGKRKQKVGKLLRKQKRDDLLHLWETRDVSLNWKVDASQEGVLSMSDDRPWTSCMRPGGAFELGPIGEVLRGSMVLYFYRPGASQPCGRVLVRADIDQPTTVSLSSGYGTCPPMWMVEDLVEELGLTLDANTADRYLLGAYSDTYRIGSNIDNLVDFFSDIVVREIAGNDIIHSMGVLDPLVSVEELEDAFEDYILEGTLLAEEGY